LAGATGWAGSALARAIAQAQDITHVSAISRSHAQRILGEVLDEPRLGCPIYATAPEALVHRCDVFVELTKPDVAKANVLAPLQHGAQVVIGTSGLTDADYAEIAAVAEQHQRGVLAVGNFALTVVLLQKFAEIAAQQPLTLDFTFVLRAPTRRVKRNVSAKKAAAACPQNGGDYDQIVNLIGWINICVNEKSRRFRF